MWVRILAVTMVLGSWSKTFNCTLLLFNQEYKWVQVRVQVKYRLIVSLKKLLRCYGTCTCIFPRKLKRFEDSYCAMTRDNNVKCLEYHFVIDAAVYNILSDIHPTNY